MELDEVANGKNRLQNNGILVIAEQYRIRGVGVGRGDWHGGGAGVAGSGGGVGVAGCAGNLHPLSNLVEMH